jgi:hypothetical protein
VRLLRTDGSGQLISAAVLNFNDEFQAENGGFPSPLDIAQYFYREGVRDSLKASAELADFQEHTTEWTNAIATGRASEIPDFKKVMDRWGRTMEKFLQYAEPYPESEDAAVDA